MTALAKAYAAPRNPFGRFSGVITYTWLPVLLVVWWWLGSANSTVFFFPPLSEALATLWAGLVSGTLLTDLAFSMTNVLVGLVIAVILGVGFGLAIGYNPTARKVVWPLLAFLRAIPGVSIVPIVIVAFGVGAGPKIFLVAATCVWPILLNTIDGVRGTSEAIMDTSRAYRLPRALYVRRVLLPSALPQIMAGIRISLSVSLTIMVVSEFTSGNMGLGYYILNGTEKFAIAQVWAGTIFIGFIGYLLNVAFVISERRILSWYFEIPRKAKRQIRP